MALPANTASATPASTIFANAVREKPLNVNASPLAHNAYAPDVLPP